MDEHHIIHTRGSLILLKDLGTWFLKNGQFSINGSLTRLFGKTI
jgi:hypothetical protein